MSEVAAVVAILAFSFFLASLFRWLLEFIPKKFRPPFSVILYLLGIAIGGLNTMPTFRCEHHHEEPAAQPEEPEATPSALVLPTPSLGNGTSDPELNLAKRAWIEIAKRQDLRQQPPIDTEGPGPNTLNNREGVDLTQGQNERTGETTASSQESNPESNSEGGAAGEGGAGETTAGEGEAGAEGAEGAEEEPEVKFYGFGCFLGLGVDILSHITPAVVLLILLPPVIFYSTIEVNWHTLRRTLAQSLLLAFPGVIVSIIFLGLYNRFALIGLEWSWEQAFLLGSILAATDPVAVVASLKDLGAPEKLTTIIEGESLLNDGSAFVMFLVFKDLVVAPGSKGFGAIFLQLIQLACGGPLFGILMGYIAYLYHRLVYNNLIVEVSVTVVGSFMTFWIADELLGVSSLLALVSFGFFYAYRGKYALSPEVEETLMHFWSIFAWYSESLIFIIAGLISYKAISEEEIASRPEIWLNLFIMFAVMTIVRFLMIWAFLPLLSRIGGGVTFKETIVMGWGGLRGAVSLTLALIVQLDINDTLYDELVLFYVAGVVALTLLVNGMTSEFVYDALKMVRPSNAELDLFTQSLRTLDEDVDIAIAKMQHNWFYKTAIWARIIHVLPRFSRAQLKGSKVKYEFPSIRWLFHGVPRAQRRKLDDEMRQDEESKMIEMAQSLKRGKSHRQAANPLPKFMRDSTLFHDHPTDQKAPSGMSMPPQNSHNLPSPNPLNQGGNHLDVERGQLGPAPYRPKRHSIESVNPEGPMRRRFVNPHMNQAVRDTLIHIDMEDEDDPTGSLMFVGQNGPGGYFDYGESVDGNPYDRYQSGVPEGLSEMGSANQRQSVMPLGPGPRHSIYGMHEPSMRSRVVGAMHRNRDSMAPSINSLGGMGASLKGQPMQRPPSALPSMLGEDNIERYKVFLNAVRARYHKQYLAGFLHDKALAVLEHAVDATADQERKRESAKKAKANEESGNDMMPSVNKRQSVIQGIFMPQRTNPRDQHYLLPSDKGVDFTRAQKLDVELDVILSSLVMPRWLLKLQELPLLGYLAKWMMYEHLHVTCEALIGYINAHHAIIQESQEQEELDEIAGIGSLKQEVSYNVRRAREHIQQLYHMHRGSIQSIQTVLATSILLRIQRDKLTHLAHEGVLDLGASAELSKGCDDMLASLKDFYKPIHEPAQHEIAATAPGAVPKIVMQHD